MDAYTLVLTDEEIERWGYRKALLFTNGDHIPGYARYPEKQVKDTVIFTMAVQDMPAYLQAENAGKERVHWPVQEHQVTFLD